MSAYYDSEFIQSFAVEDTRFVDLAEYDDLIEHDAHFGAHSLQSIAEDAYSSMTPKINQDIPQGHYTYETGPRRDGKLPIASDVYDMGMSTPPLSPSTTISSLHTDDFHSRSEESLGQRVERDEIRKGKQPEMPSNEEGTHNDGLAAQDDEDWYGMQYAMERSRMDDSSVMWPPSAGESSTSDAAFVAMYDGRIYPQDVDYWYAHWCKWHRALAREEKRRRDRASSDAKRTRTYHHATYVQWEQAQRKKYMQQAPGNGAGSKPMSNNPSRHRASTCLF